MAASVALLQTDPVAARLLRSTIPARLSYVWKDGTPRVVPMWFHWTGEDFLMGAPPNAPKVLVIGTDTPVGLVVDDSTWPYQVLTVQGLATAEVLADGFAEYGMMAERYLGADEAAGFMAARQQTFGGLGWTRITIRPTAAQLLDFGVGKFPSAWSQAGAAS